VADDTDAGGNRIRADIKSWNVMLNGFYDFDIGSALRPYVGAESVLQATA
jgi:opacity protein-like surface antigen